MIISFLVCVKCPNTGRCGPEKTPYLGTFHAVICIQDFNSVFHLTRNTETPKSSNTRF